MGWDATGTLPPPREERVASPSGTAGSGLVAGSAGAAVVAVTAGVAWWSTRLGGSNLTMVLIVVLAGAGALVVRAVGRHAGRLPRRAAVGAVLAAGAVLLALAHDGTLLSIKVRADLDDWTAQAEQAIAGTPDPGYACESFPVDPPSLPAFGRVDERCVSRSPGYRSVTYSQRDAMGGWTGLLYSPDVAEPRVMSQCVAHLAGPWWQTAWADPMCPSGFTFVGGG